MFQETLKSVAPVIKLPEVPANNAEMHTRCKCGKFVALSYINCPVCGTLITKPKTEPLPVEPVSPVEQTEEKPKRVRKAK